MADPAAIRKKIVEKFRGLAVPRLERLNNALLALENNPADRELLHGAQRELHTLKGEAHILGFQTINRITHQTEELLFAAQAQGFKHKGLIDAILKGFDLTHELLAGLTGEAEPVIDTSEFEHVAQALLHGQTQDVAPAEVVRPQPTASVQPQPHAGVDKTVHVTLERLDQLTEMVGDLQIGHSIGRQLYHQLTDAMKAGDEEGLGNAATQARQSNQPTHRLDVDELRAQLVTLRQGHMRLRSECQQAIHALRDHLFDDDIRLQRINQYIRDLRMLPLASLFQRYPRAVRDLAKQLHKQVILEVAGADVEADKVVLDEVHDALLHLLRNAIDHGIEDAAERQHLGKPLPAVVTISAELSGSHVAIHLTDDGRGINPSAIRSRAIEKRLLSAEAAASTSDDDIVALLFVPGFSTRNDATDISGRGVGLDAVKRVTEGLGGTVSVDSQPGSGTTFTLRVPISVTLSKALVFEAGGGTYTLQPDSVKLAARAAAQDLEHAGDTTIFRDKDGTPVPVVDMSMLLNPNAAAAPLEQSRPLALLEHAGQRCAFWVDKFLGTQAVLQKPAGKLLAANALLRGTTVLTDGAVAVALDSHALLDGALNHKYDKSHSGHSSSQEQGQAPLLLVVDDSELTRDLIVGMLRESGYRIIEAVNGNDALEKLREHTPDLILTDLQMPVLDGFGLIKRVRASSEWRDLPLVVLSTLGSQADKHQAASLGADAYLVKTELSKSQLQDTLNRFVELLPTGLST